MLNFEYKGTFLDKIKKRVKTWESSPKQTMKITIPDTLRWVWYLEDGTREGKGPYIIVPTSGNTKLVFFSGGNIHFSDSVIHPGIRARHFIAQSMPDIRRMINEGILISLDNPNEVQELLKEIGEKGKKIILDNLAASTKSEFEKMVEHQEDESGVETGRLKGEAASTVFEREAKVVVGE